MTVTYIDEVGDPNDGEPITLEDHPLWWHLQGLQQTASGYGQRLTTRYKVRHNGRLYRVYATCFSNAASHWIIAGGVKLHIADYQVS
jgi:hypothetical protein